REDDGLFLCINASNRARDLAWMRTWCAGLDAAIEDLSDELAMLALQGPTSIDVARAVCDPAPDRLGYYRLTRATVLGVPDVMVSRTGYTGEDGFEFYFPAGEAERFWNGLMEAGAGAGLTPIGLGARDTLRLEAGMPLYGHEIDDSTTPVEAGLLWACDRTWEFVGGPAIREVAERGAARRLIGFTCQGRRVPREGYPILS
ncbi:MAG: glycine cleavage system protein T, partial [Rhodocyclaceae bacterium]|nr:glycine cleavage system protein T [Rhodocyclaceae bacterium]